MSTNVIRSRKQVEVKIAMLKAKKAEAAKRQLGETVISELEEDVSTLTVFFETHRLPDNRYDNARLWLVGDPLTTLDD